ncbi:DNRLRE domain-containing protein [Nocardioides sp. LML1-1-1.1]|uniref:DNRLRE domain-containing protein n=1 Tax=Nocardioides sp. LML1-1-1.1 TaxID=3135248 RepID=UPI003425E487
MKVRRQVVGAAALVLVATGGGVAATPWAGADEGASPVADGSSDDPIETTADSITYQNPDGSLTTELEAGPVRYLDDGTWRDIDTTLVHRDGAWVPKASPLDLQFSDGGSEPFASLERDGGDSVALGWPRDLPEPIVDGATLTYKDALPAGDLVVTALATGFSHSVVLNEAPAPGQTFEVPIPLDLDGTKVQETASGGLRVSNPDDKALTAPRPVMWDAEQDAAGMPAEVRPIDVAIEDGVAQRGSDAVLVLRPDAAILSDPSTTYPVTIDPTFTIPSPAADTFVQNAGSYTSGGTVDGWSTLRVGTQDSGDHVARTFVRFNAISQSALSAWVIDDADLQLRAVRSLSCTNGSTIVHRVTESWSPSTIAWSDLPTVASSSAPPQYYLPHGGPAGSSCAAHGWATWDVKSMVQAWQAGAGQYGFQLSAATPSANGSYREFRSSELSPTDTTYHPKLVITYRLRPGTPSGLSISPSRGSVTATGMPTLRATLTDGDSSQITGAFRIFDDDGQPLGTLTSAPVASGGSATVEVPEDLLTANQAYSFDVQASDGSLTSSISSPTNFMVKPALTAIPAPACNLPCIPVSDQVLLDELLPGGSSRSVAVRIPDVRQGSVDRIQTTASFTEAIATGSVSIADADFAATEPASFQYGEESVTGTAEIYPSYDNDAITVTNKGASPVRVRLVLNAWIPVDTSNDAALDEAEAFVDDDAANAAIEEDPSTYEDVQSTTKMVTTPSRESFVQVDDSAEASQAPAPVQSTYPCPQDDDPDALCRVETSRVPMNTDDVSDAKANLSDPPTSPVTGRVDLTAARAIGPSCFEKSAATLRWASRSRRTLCSSQKGVLTFTRRIKGVWVVTGMGYYVEQRLVITNWENPKITMYTRWLRLKQSWGEAEKFLFTHSESCISGCTSESYSETWDEPTNLLTAASPKTRWYSRQVTAWVTADRVVRPTFVWKDIGCSLELCQKAPIGEYKISGLVRCDKMWYLRIANPGCVNPYYIPTFYMKLSSNAPETARHIAKAQAKLATHPGRRNADGTGNVLVRKVWDTRIKEENLNRREARRQCAAMQKSGSCDEYAFASTYQGCHWMRCDVDRIDLDDNVAGGRQLNSLLYRPSRVLDGDAYWVKIVP